MIKKVAVVGAGQMGNGITHVFALHNFDVTMYDVSESQLEKAKNTIEKNNHNLLRILPMLSAPRSIRVRIKAYIANIAVST